jgi:carbon starvation protein
MLKQVPQMLFNDHLNTALTALFLVLTWVLVLDTARVCSRVLRGLSTPPFSEVPYARTELAA